MKLNQKKKNTKPIIYKNVSVNSNPKDHGKTKQKKKERKNNKNERETNVILEGERERERRQRKSGFGVVGEAMVITDLRPTVVADSPISTQTMRRGA